MKNTLTTIALSTLLITGASAANHMDSDLNLRLFNNQPIKVQIDDQQCTGYQAASTVFLTDLRPGRHFINVWTNNYGRHQGKQLAYRGFIDIPAASHVSALITRNFNLVITDVDPICFSPEPFGNTESQYHNQYDHHGNHDGHSTSPYVYPNGYNTQCGPMVMSSADFSALKHCIASKSFDSTRLMLAKDGIRNTAVTACQVEELMQLLSFESSRLELAKFAYQYTVDRDRYFTVYDAFTFDSSVRELSNFIGHRS